MVEKTKKAPRSTPFYELRERVVGRVVVDCVRVRLHRGGEKCWIDRVRCSVVTSAGRTNGLTPTRGHLSQFRGGIEGGKERARERASIS